MRTGPWRRALVLLLSAPAVLASPVVSLAHGVGHRADGADRFARGEAHGHAHGAVLAPGAVASPFDAHHDHHAHPDLEATLSGRGDLVTAGLPVLCCTVVVAGGDDGSRRLIEHARVRAHGSHAPPPSLRGPPPKQND